MPSCHGCARWTRLPWGSAGYKAGTCAITGRQTTAIEVCASHAERPIDWAAWGVSPPPERQATALSPIAASAAAQISMDL